MSKYKTARLLEMSSRPPKGYDDFSMFYLHSPPTPGVDYTMEIIVSRILDLDHNLKCARTLHANSLDTALFMDRESFRRTAVEAGRVKRSIRATRAAWLDLIRPKAKDLRKILSML